MREKYESLPLTELKAIAKARGLRGISTMRKPELIERMLQEDEKEKPAEKPQVTEEKKEPEEPVEKFEYKETGEATTGLGALLKGLKF